MSFVELDYSTFKLGSSIFSQSILTGGNMLQRIALSVIAAMTVSTTAMANDWNVQFAPISSLIGLIDMNVQYKLADQWTVGPTILSWNLSAADISFSASGFGVRGTYAFDKALSDGWYVSGGMGTMSFAAKSGAYSSNVSGTQMLVGGGYHWFWDSFNLNLGFTTGSSSVTKVEVKDASGTVVSSSSVGALSGGLEFMIGWTF